jgi:hypothetical protein
VKFCITAVANSVPVNIPQIKQKLIVDPAVPFISSLTAVIPSINVKVVTNPLVNANNTILMIVNIPTKEDYIK